MASGRFVCVCVGRGGSMCPFCPPLDPGLKTVTGNRLETLGKIACIFIYTVRKKKLHGE